MTEQFQSIIRMNDEDGQRWYQHEGLEGKPRVPSVTTVIDHYMGRDDQDYLLSVDKETNDMILQKTSQIGNEIQELCILQQGEDQEKYQARLKELPAARVKVMKSWVQIVEREKIRPIHWGRRVFSTKYGYAGEIDFEVEIDGNVSICDIKSGKYKYKAGYQVQAYREALIEMGAYKREDLGASVLHLPRDGSKARLYTFQHHEFCFVKFLSLLELFKGDYAWKLAQEGVSDGLEATVDSLYGLSESA